MPLQHIFIVYLIGTLIVFLPSFGFAKLFAKAGVPSWKAFIPFYNTWIMQGLAKRPKHWVFWQFIPVVGWFISPGIFIEFAKVFGRFSLGAHTAAALVAPVYFPYLAYKEDPKYIGAEAVKNHKKKGWREWVDAAIFAIVAATLIRTFIFEAYTIPSGSMEKSLLINDFLFVSKLSYGPRIPNTPLSVPFVHNYLPFGSSRKSYSEAIKLPYMRWFESPVKRNDAVVFNFPAGDTVINLPNFQSKDPYYDVCRRMGRGNIDEGRKVILNDPDNYPLAIHPVDKSDNYIKRCVGIAGDVLEVKKGIVYIDGKEQPLPPASEAFYVVTTKLVPDADILKEEYEVDYEKGEYESIGINTFRMLLTAKAKEKMLQNGFATSIVLDEAYNGGGGEVFPNNQSFKWSRDNYGPIWIPKKNMPVQLNDSTYLLYERAIRVYEKNEFFKKDDKFYLNGKEVSSYTFKMNYYWMMGDNRQGSQDSRYWGFVPEDRVVGKAWLIWFSWEGGPRWKRLFRTVK
ncbi:MAG TPA: S26 family signal peptidase [Chitinophagaceae bacterium]|nr:S26 family signal peptidase [Chitinophagaceae bacterium]HNU13614.1 S26 family signal peptidase [Chitinophagaceae bacterium]